jgi:hypothetical protein
MFLGFTHFVGAGCNAEHIRLLKKVWYDYLRKKNIGDIVEKNNWYKKSSNNIQFLEPEIIADKVNWISEQTAGHLKDYVDNGKFFFPDFSIDIKTDYLGNFHRIPIHFKQGDGGALAYFNYSDNDEFILFYIDNLITNYNITKENFEENGVSAFACEIKSVLIHELTHAVDPKRVINENRYLSTGSEYFKDTKDIEYDATCQAICFKVATYLKKWNDREADLKILNWMRSYDFNRCPDFLKMYMPFFEEWDRSEVLKRRFFSRLHNEIEKSSRNIFANIKSHKLVRLPMGTEHLAFNGWKK